MLTSLVMARKPGDDAKALGMQIAVMQPLLMIESWDIYRS